MYNYSYITCDVLVDSTWPRRVCFKKYSLSIRNLHSLSTKSLLWNPQGQRKKSPRASLGQYSENSDYSGIFQNPIPRKGDMDDSIAINTSLI